MSELRFESSLTMDEIESNFRDVDFFSGIMDGLQEALAYEKGKGATEPVVRKMTLTAENE